MIPRIGLQRNSVWGLALGSHKHHAHVPAPVALSTHEQLFAFISPSFTPLNAENDEGGNGIVTWSCDVVFPEISNLYIAQTRMLVCPIYSALHFTFHSPFEEYVSGFSSHALHYLLAEVARQAACICLITKWLTRVHMSTSKHT